MLVLGDGSQRSAVHLPQVRPWKHSFIISNAAAEPATAPTSCERLALLRCRTRLVPLARVRSWHTRASWLLPLPSGRICGSTVSCLRCSTLPNCRSLWPRRLSLTLEPAVLRRCAVLLHSFLCERYLHMLVRFGEVLHFNHIICQSKSPYEGLKQCTLCPPTRGCVALAVRHALRRACSRQQVGAGHAVPHGLEAVCVAACSSAPLGAQRAAAAAARAALRPGAPSQLRSSAVATSAQMPAVALREEQRMAQPPRRHSWATASLFLRELAEAMLLPGRGS